MRFPWLLLSILSTIGHSPAAFSEGLVFADTYEGKVIVSEPASETLQVDFSGEAARKTYEHLREDSNIEKLFSRNPRGEIVEDVLRNSKITCSSSRRFEKYFCQIRLVRE